ncbi:MAG: tetratricopeptide repeat protein [Nitrospira sp.]|nr:tetratricopeptide repeat protein [Nitrospira sp.]
MNREERRRDEKVHGKQAKQAVGESTFLRDVQRHHQAGRLDEAERGYRLLLERRPSNADALHGLGLLLYRRGHLREAVSRLAEARAADARNPVYCFNYGVVLQRAGLLDEAVEAYGRAIQLNPRYLEARTNLGNAYKDLRRLPEAQATYEEVLRLHPEHAEAHNNLGVVLKERGRLEEAAEAYRRAIALKPNHAEAHNNLGLVLLEQGQTDEAIRSFERALQAYPGYGTALYNLGIAWMWREEMPRALRCFAETAQAKHAHGRPVTDTSVFRSRLKHDAEQVAYLVERGLLGETWRGYQEALIRLLAKIEAAPGATTGNRVPVSPADLQPIAPSFNRLLYVAPCDTIAEGALSSDLDTAAIEARYLSTQPEVTYIDGLLSEEALRRLREFCWMSTIWKKDYENGYIGAFLGDGFASPLLLQIAEELRRRLPRIFGRHRLTQAWAFKHDSARRGLNIHADAAAVNVNFWITPDEANRDPESGGLVVWDKEAPGEWDFRTYNSDSARGKIYEWLKNQGAREITIPYRANRAVLFNSDLFHETDDIAFQEGFTNRRINITLLYGHRHRP